MAGREWRGGKDYGEGKRGERGNGEGREKGVGRNSALVVGGIDAPVL